MSSNNYWFCQKAIMCDTVQFLCTAFRVQHKEHQERILEGGENVMK